MFRLKIGVSLAAILSLAFAGATMAAPADGETVARGGVIRCGGGGNFLRLGGSEIHFNAYVLRNRNSAITITIDRMVFFNASGNVIFDSAESGLPAADNGILGPTDNTLEPNQTARFDTSDFLPFLAQTDRPIQMEIEWSSTRRALVLHSSLTTIARGRNPSTGQSLEERSRSSGQCASIRLN